MKTIKVSQSMHKDYDDYLAETLCGDIFKAKYIDKTWNRTWNDSDSKAEGRYFEYVLTGAKPTGYKDAPKPVYMKTPLKKKKPEELTVEDMDSRYRMIHRKAEFVKSYLEKSGIKIQSAQVYREKGCMDGNIDIEAEYKGQEINIDVKWSGMIHNKWDRFGWMWTKEQTEYNGKQAKQYTALNGRPTYFLVVNSADKDEIRFFKTNIDEFVIEQHVLKSERLIENVHEIDSVGWVNFPSLEKCRECPLRTSCKDMVDELVVEEIDIIDFD